MLRNPTIGTYDIDRSIPYFHGAKTKKAAENIIQRGIQPNLAAQNHLMSPYPNAIYVTPHIAYAQIYALGCACAEHKIPSFITKKYGQNGYVFVVAGSDLGEVQPDEDSIGEMVKRGEPRWLDRLAKEALDDMRPDTIDDPYWAGDTGLEEYFGQSVYEMMKAGDYAVWAFGGKTLVDMLSDEQKVELIRLGSHIANIGPVMPSECWEIPRKKSKILKSDGSNFFEVAQLMWRAGA